MFDWKEFFIVCVISLLGVLIVYVITKRIILKEKQKKQAKKIPAEPEFEVSNEGGKRQMHERWGRFSYAIPNGWELTKIDGDKYHSMLRYDENGKVNSKLAVYDLSYHEPLERFLENLQEDFNLHSPGTEVVLEAQFETAQALTCQPIVIKGAVYDHKSFGRQFFFHLGRRLLYVNLTTPIENERGNTFIALQLVNSLRIDDEEDYRRMEEGFSYIIPQGFDLFLSPEQTFPFLVETEPEMGLSANIFFSQSFFRGELKSFHKGNIEQNKRFNRDWELLKTDNFETAGGYTCYSTLYKREENGNEGLIEQYVLDQGYRKLSLVLISTFESQFQNTFLVRKLLDSLRLENYPQVESIEDYRHYEATFSYIPPENWYFVKWKNKVSKEFYGLRASLPKNDFQANLLFSSGKFGGSLEKYVERSVKGMGQKYKQFQVIHKEASQTDSGMAYISVLAKNVVDGIPRLQKTYYFSDGDKKILLMYKSDISGEVENDQAVEAMMKTIRLEEGKKPSRWF